MKFDALGNENYLNEIVSQMRRSVRTCGHAEVFLKALFSKAPTDFKSLAGIASLIQKLSGNILCFWPSSFAEVVNFYLQREFGETNALEFLDKDAENKMIRLVVVASELFQRKFLAVHDLKLWLLHRFFYYLPIEVLDHVSGLISSNLKAFEDENLAQMISNLNAAIGKKTSATIAEISRVLKEVGTVITGYQKIIKSQSLSVCNQRNIENK